MISHGKILNLNYFENSNNHYVITFMLATSKYYKPCIIYDTSNSTLATDCIMSGIKAGQRIIIKGTFKKDVTTFLHDGTRIDDLNVINVNNICLINENYYFTKFTN